MESVNLTHNPFYVLGVSFRDGKNVITDAYERALSEGNYDEQTLMTAYQALMAPKPRLDAEISWLIGLSPARVQSVIEAIDKLPINSELKALLNEIEGLSRANLIAHLCSIQEAGTSNLETLITQLVASQNDFAIAEIAESINSNRAISKFPKLDVSLIEEALNSLRERHCEIVKEAIISTDQPGKMMTLIVEKFLNSKDPVRGFLEDIVERYDSWTTPKLREISDEIGDAEKNLRSEPTDRTSITTIVNKIKAWDEYSQARQLIFESKGLDEPKSKEIYKNLRELCLWLANEKGQYSSALKISEALLETFPELPTVLNQASEDIETLQELVEKAKSEEIFSNLIILLNEARENTYTLVESVMSDKFAPGNESPVGILYKEFINTVELSKDTELYALPFQIMRGLAVYLNNELDSSEAALKILDVIKDLSPPAEELDQINKDYKTVICNQAFKCFENCMNQGELKAALEPLDILIKNSDDVELKKNMTETKMTIEGRMVRKRLKMAFWAGIAVLIIWFTISENNSTSVKSASSHKYSRDASTTSQNKPKIPSFTKNKAQNSEMESKPPIGQGRVLSKSEVRYCLFQNERMETIRELISTDHELNRFNELVDDYNSRCSNFRYYQGALSAVRSELKTANPRLRREAHELVQSWRKESGFVFLDPNNRMDAMKIQRRLKELGYYAGDIDGIWGPGSKSALRNAKRSNGYPNNSKWDIATQIALFRAPKY